MHFDPLDYADDDAAEVEVEACATFSSRFWIDKPPPWKPTPQQYYASSHLIGSSALADFRESRQQFFRVHLAQAVEKRQTDAMMLGSLVDMLLTEPDEIAGAYAITRAKRRGTKAWHRAAERYPGRQLVKSHLMDSAKRIVQAILRNPIAAGMLLGEGASQVCHAWMDRGIMCRARFDRVFVDHTVPYPKPAFADLKVWNVIEPKPLARQIYERGAHRQLALYERGFEDLWGVRPRCFLVVVSSKEPHEVTVKNLSEDFMEMGRRDVDQDLTDLCSCLRRQDFSNWWESCIETVNPPPWAK